ncbi:hypothetical protein J7T55_014281 [Diaporthe amygdali]|uniref:uncharacterized protein n=1 Tax=Phomopsis amygdali TaxID=1214568 RepID=UPI0022FEDD42|nr:uncharacterized protein J7T55_014281 [Diaporthe amygdali]KAJ0100742.1 hypothetical protein J7T55_014281 [Diaporthe amygdali]
MYSQIQDTHHQPPFSPENQHYPFSGHQYAEREFVVKREFANATLPQLSRHNPTSSSSEQSLSPSSSTIGPHPPSHMQGNRHMIHNNDAGQVYQYGSYSAPPLAPLPSRPQPPPTPYDQMPIYTKLHNTYPITSYTIASKRNSQRASQFKAKCDENKPCKNCVDKSINCQYRDSAPKQQDKATQDIIDVMKRMLQSTNQKIIAGLAEVQSNIRDLKGIRPGSLHAQKSLGLDDCVKEELGAVTPLSLSEGEGILSRRMRALGNEMESEESPGNPVQPLPVPFPHNHTTTSGQLLKWPAVSKLVRPLLDNEHIKYVEAYPQRYEEDRGELPLFERGEGPTSLAGNSDLIYHRVQIPDDASLSDHPSPLRGTDCGLIGDSASSGVYPAESRAKSRSECALDFSRAKVEAYVDAYKKHIQNMHPLIPPDDLDDMICAFLAEVLKNPSGIGKHRQVATITKHQQRPAQSSFEYVKKRERSRVASSVRSGSAPESPKPQRSVRNALVLLVLALGKICMWRDRKLPDPPEKRGPDPVLSTIQGSPYYSAFSQSSGQAGLPSRMDQQSSGGSRRSSAQVSGVQAPTSAASLEPTKRNNQIIPGLEYFAYATDVLGNHLGSYELNYVQAHVLACLYYGQLGRVIPSFRHIRFAGSAIADKLQSDILAELNLVPSGILQYENILPFPDLTVMRERLGFSDEVTYSYAAQLYLRKRLNRISGSLYDPDKKPNAEAQKKILAEIEKDLGEKSTVWLGPFKFDRDAPPARDILSARIRATFWGANVITYRPSIKTVLEFGHKRQNDVSAESEAVPHENAGEWGTVRSDPGSRSDIDQVVFKNARKGIDAVIKSTMAFHGLKDKRFIITNVFGTAHACLLRSALGAVRRGSPAERSPEENDRLVKGPYTGPEIFRSRTFDLKVTTEALLIDVQSPDPLVDEMPDSVDDYYIKEAITNLCGSLVEVRNSSGRTDEGSRTIHLAHFSVRQYFLSNASRHGESTTAREHLGVLNPMEDDAELGVLCLHRMHEDMCKLATVFSPIVDELPEKDADNKRHKAGKDNTSASGTRAGSISLVFLSAGAYKTEKPDADTPGKDSATPVQQEFVEVMLWAAQRQVASNAIGVVDFQTLQPHC